MTEGTTLHEIFDLYELPTGRRAYAYGLMLDAAKKKDDGVLVALLNEAIAKNEKCRLTEKAWDASQSTVTSSAESARLRELDSRVDKGVTRIRDVVVDQLEALDEDEDAAATSRLRLFMDTHFPKGAQAYTKIANEEEYQLVTKLVADIRAGDADVVEMLALELVLKPLDKVLPKYKAAIDESNARKGVTWKDVQLARSVAHEVMLGLVGLLVGRHWSAADVKLRQEVLSPILSQNAKLREAYRARRDVRDVDPSTGVELLPVLVSTASAPATVPAASPAPAGDPDAPTD